MWVEYECFDVAVTSSQIALTPMSSEDSREISVTAHYGGALEICCVYYIWAQIT